MSTTDKTGEKLLASIRKTKAGGSSPENTDGIARGATTASPAATRRKTAPKSRSKTAATPAAKRATPATKRTTPAKAEKTPADPYQAGRRIWPD